MMTFARLAFGAFFLGSAVLKMWKMDALLAMLAAAGFAQPLGWLLFAASCQAVAAIALLSGVAVREAALGLVAYVACINIFMHPFWAFQGEAAAIQFQLFTKNLGIMAGLLAVASAYRWYLAPPTQKGLVSA